MTTKKRKQNAPSWVKEVRMCRDMVPPRSAMERLAKLSVDEDPQNVIPGLDPAPAEGLLLPARIAALTAAKWANGRTIKIAFLGGTAKQQDFVKKVASRWLDYANVGFEWGVKANASDVRIDYNEFDGAWSYMGNQALGISKRQATMNFGWLDDAVVLHEFGHMLAMIHEHQHPEAGIPWNKDAVYAYFGGPPNYWDKATVDSNLFAKYGREVTQFSSYDAKSIMHYAIEAKLLTDPSRAVGWNTELSETDRDYIGKIYPKAAPPPVGGEIITLDVKAKLARIPKDWTVEKV